MTNKQKPQTCTVQDPIIIDFADDDFVPLAETQLEQAHDSASEVANGEMSEDEYRFISAVIGWGIAGCGAFALALILLFGGLV